MHGWYENYTISRPSLQVSNLLGGNKKPWLGILQPGLISFEEYSLFQQIHIGRFFVVLIIVEVYVNRRPTADLHVIADQLRVESGVRT